MPRRVAVVGAGWAGIAAAVHARLAGHQVQVYEMAPRAGGRARGVRVDGLWLDNGQHILIGAYAATLELMHAVGADPQALLMRLPLALQYPDGQGLRLPAGAPVPAFARAVWSRPGWDWAARWALLARAARWAAGGFRAPPSLSVAQLCAGLPSVLHRQLIEPLCVAALNTPAAQASAGVFLRVLRDALFSGPGSSDLLLPRASLSTLLPEPASDWFEAQGVRLLTGTRVRQLKRDASVWRVDGEAFDAVVLACSATEAARLCNALAPDWARRTAALQYEPIVTVYLRCPGLRLPLPMLALEAGPEAPAQFVFDLGALGQSDGVMAFVISGARDWVERGLQATAEATLSQARAAFVAHRSSGPPAVLHVAAEKRATFRCTPGLDRPPGRIAPGLLAAGDYVAGPYPATLEGAVRSGREAAAALSEAAPAG